MKPWVQIAEARAADGTALSLARRGDEWVVRCEGRPLMSTRQHGSEEALAQLGLALVKKPSKVFLGGLGLGFTARAALARLPEDSKLIIAERTQAIVDWNRTYVGTLSGNPLEDLRVELLVTDAVEHIYRYNNRYDALLFDLDNGPSAQVHASNERLYGPAGISACMAALRPGGALAVWSAGPDAAYLKRLGKAGFDASEKIIPARGAQGGVRHVIFLGARR